MSKKVTIFLEHNTIFESLAIRKMALIEKSFAFVIFPGGFGTLDELSELLLKCQINDENLPIFLYGSAFWSKFKEFVEVMQKESLVELDERFMICDEPNFIIEKIKDYYENLSRNERGR